MYGVLPRKDSNDTIRSTIEQVAGYTCRHTCATDLFKTKADGDSVRPNDLLDFGRDNVQPEFFIV